MQKGSAEHGGYARGFTSIWITENNTVALPDEDGLLGQILYPYNLSRVYLKVCRNKGSHGVDGLTVESLSGTVVVPAGHKACACRATNRAYIKIIHRSTCSC